MGSGGLFVFAVKWTYFPGLFKGTCRRTWGLCLDAFGPVPCAQEAEG